MMTDDCSDSGNWWLVAARASGQGIAVCLSSLLLTMCRPLLTLLRRLGVHSFLPLDLHVTYHQTCGLVLAILSVIHTVCHLGNLEMNLIPDSDTNPGNHSLTQWLLTSHISTLGAVPGQTEITNINSPTDSPVFQATAIRLECGWCWCSVGRS